MQLLFETHLPSGVEKREKQAINNPKKAKYILLLYFGEIIWVATKCYEER